MAARRLILVMLVLLGISTVIAVVTPQPDRQDPAEEKDSATGATGATGKSATTGSTGASGAGGTGKTTGTSGAGKAGGGPAQSAIPGTGTGSAADATVINPTGSPKTIESAPGERVLLLVKVDATAEVEIRRLGRVETATPYAPARFDLVLPASPGRYRVTNLNTGKVRAEIIARD